MPLYALREPFGSPDILAIFRVHFHLRLPSHYGPKPYRSVVYKLVLREMSRGIARICPLELIHHRVEMVGGHSKGGPKRSFLLVGPLDFRSVVAEAGPFPEHLWLGTMW